MARRPRSFHTGRKGALVLVLILLHAIPVSAGREVVLDPEEQFQFAEQYFRSGEYYRAIGEYERFIYFFPRILISRQVFPLLIWISSGRSFRAKFFLH